MSLRVSSLNVEGLFQASKFLKVQVLCSKNELKELFDRLGDFWIYPLTGLVDGEPIAKERFLEGYGAWIEALKAGRTPDEADLKKMLAAAWTREEDALWKQEVPGAKYLIRIAKPVLQVQAHFFTYSKVDGVFRPGTMGQNQIFWGLQFSFPQIYQDPKTMEMCEAGDSVNKEMFSIIRQWVRDFTRATPFVVDGVKTNSPIRLGKECFEWIGNHCQLKTQGIGIHE